MRISPYIAFNGNCGEAVTHYEKAFDSKAVVMRYKDAPPNSEYPIVEGTENLVMHAQLEVGGEALMFSDMPPDSPVKSGDNLTITVEFDTKEQATATFEVLKDGGTVSMDLQETFWSPYFGTVTDKFGIIWNISIAEEKEFSH